MVDAEVAADADEPGLEIGAPVERVHGAEDLEKDVLRQILGLVMTADELVGEVEDLAPVLAHDELPGLLIACEAARDELVGDGNRCVGDGIAGHQRERRAWRGRMITKTSGFVLQTSQAKRNPTSYNARSDMAFDRVEGRLACDGVPLDAIAAAAGTPVHV